MSTTSAVSMATSVPAPMAMPRSAWASAGASFTPSPTMATARSALLELGDVGGLVGREDLGDDGVDAEIAGDALGGGLVVTGEHHDLHSQVVKRGDGGARRWAGARRRCRSPRRPLPSTATKMAVRPEAASCACRASSAPSVDAVGFHQPCVADRDAPAVHDRSGAAPRARSRTRRRPAWARPALVGAPDDGLGQRVLRLALEGRGQGEDCAFVGTRRPARPRRPRVRLG